MRRPAIYASQNVIGPPGMSAEITQTLRDALAEAMSNEQFATGLERFAGIQNRFTNGTAAQQELMEAVNTFIKNKGEIDLIARGVHAKYVR